MKNWLGLDAHPSDKHLHWTDSYTDAQKLREAWDTIAALGQLDNLQLIVEYAKHEAMLTENEQHCGEDI